MATHKSAQKRARQAEQRRMRNRPVRSRTKSLVKEVRAALERSDPAEAARKLREAESGMRKAASQGVIPRGRASRSIARLARAVGRLASSS